MCISELFLQDFVALLVEMVGAKPNDFEVILHQILPYLRTKFQPT